VSVAGAPFAFIGAGEAEGRVPPAPLDRADHLRDDADALAALWSTARVIVLDEQGNALADADHGPLIPVGAEITGGPGGVGAAAFLGLDAEGGAWFSLDAALTAWEAPSRIDLRSAAATWPLREAAVFAEARALQHWRARHRYCGICGGEVSRSRAGWLGRCTQCNAEHYPRTDPAVIVAVSDGERLLLGRQAGWPPRRYSVIAGFVEPGESLEQTVVREVAEETGVRVRACRYAASQPWPFPSALMLGFTAQAEPDEPRVSDELEDARWFTLDEVRAAQQRRHDDPGEGLLLSPRISIARWLIDAWVDSRLAG